VHGNGGQIYNQFSPDRVLNRGTIHADTAASTISLTRVSNDLQGTIYASDGGVISWSNPTANTGTIHAGAGGLVSISGVFENSPGGMVNIDIGGTATSQFGRVTVTGAAMLDGTLNLATLNGFSPAIGDAFQVMTFPSRTGEFAPVNGLIIGNGNAFVPIYNATNLTLNVVAAGPALSATQDSDGDGFPDAQELLAGTDAHDPASALRLSATRTAGSGVALEFPTVPGRTYALECCTDLARGVWITLRTNLPGDGDLLHFIDTTAATRGPQCFYRVRVWR
jgi:hypothetical protein